MFCRGIPRASGEKGGLEVYVFSGYLVRYASKDAPVLFMADDQCSAAVELRQRKRRIDAGMPRVGACARAVTG
jgi:hypothetical protein